MLRIIRMILIPVTLKMEMFPLQKDKIFWVLSLSGYNCRHELIVVQNAPDVSGNLLRKSPILRQYDTCLIVSKHYIIDEFIFW